MHRTLRALLVPLVLFLALVAVPATAGAALAPGNSAAAKACQQGGFTRYARSDNTPFANTGECVSYATKGGTLRRLPMPDLRLDASCIPDASSHRITCTFTTTNSGSAPLTGDVLLRASISIPVGRDDGQLDATITTGGDRDCPGGQPVMVNFNTGGVPMFGTIDVTCGVEMLAPGAQVDITIIFSVETDDPSVPITFAAAVDPKDDIVEFDETNNSFNDIIETP